MNKHGYKTRYQKEQEEKINKQKALTMKKCSNCAYSSSCKVSQSIVRMSKHYKDINEIDMPVNITDIIHELAVHCKRYVYNNLKIG